MLCGTLVVNRLWDHLEFSSFCPWNHAGRSVQNLSYFKRVALKFRAWTRLPFSFMFQSPPSRVNKLRHERELQLAPKKRREIPPVCLPELAPLEMAIGMFDWKIKRPGPMPCGVRAGLIRSDLF